jgi:hypothetical protein
MFQHDSSFYIVLHAKSIIMQWGYLCTNGVLDVSYCKSMDLSFTIYELFCNAHLRRSYFHTMLHIQPIWSFNVIMEKIYTTLQKFTQFPFDLEIDCFEIHLKCFKCFHMHKLLWMLHAKPTNLKVTMLWYSCKTTWTTIPFHLV